MLGRAERYAFSFPVVIRILNVLIDNESARRRVAALALPALLDRARNTLDAFVADARVRGALPFPRCVSCFLYCCFAAVRSLAYLCRPLRWQPFCVLLQALASQSLNTPCATGRRSLACPHAQALSRRPYMRSPRYPPAPSFLLRLGSFLASRC